MSITPHYVRGPDGEWVRVADEHAKLAEPTLAELATNFTGAVARWAGQGFPTVPAEQYVARAAVCEACEFWDGTARLGLGKCNAPGCGCTKLKRWLATEKCPIGKWPELAPNEKQPIPPAS